nr:MAG TPA: hypothetical protein [Caudoviricetes sp.]
MKQLYANAKQRGYKCKKFLKGDQHDQEDNHVRRL